MNILTINGESKEKICQSITARDSTDRDDQRLGDFLISTFAETSKSKNVIDTLHPDRLKELTATRERRKNGLVRIFEIGGDVIGTYSLHRPGSSTSGSWIETAYYFSSLAIHPKLQGLGLGKSLLLEAQEKVRQNNNTTLTFHVNIHALQLQQFYMNLGCFPDEQGDCLYFGIKWKGFKWETKK